MTLRVAVNEPYNRMFLFTAKTSASKGFPATHPLTEITSNTGKRNDDPNSNSSTFPHAESLLTSK